MKFIFTLICLFCSLNTWGDIIVVIPPTIIERNGIVYSCSRTDSECYLSKYKKQETNIIIPAKFVYTENRMDVSKSVVGVSKNAFKDLPFVKTVNLPYTIRDIKDSAFVNCINLRKLTIWGCKNLGKDAFAQCENLDSLIINDVVPPSCKGFTNEEIYTRTTLIVPFDALSRYKNDRFFSRFRKIEGTPINCEFTFNGFKFRIKSQNKAEIIGFEPKQQKNIIIPDSVSYMGNMYAVTAIADYVFRGVDSLKNIVIPYTVYDMDRILGDGEEGKGKIIWNFSNTIINPYEAFEYVMPYVGGYDYEDTDVYKNNRASIRPMFNHIMKTKGASFNNNNRLVSIISVRANNNTRSTFQAVTQGSSILVKGLNSRNYYYYYNSIDGSYPYRSDYNKENSIDLNIRINGLGDFCRKNYLVPTMHIWPRIINVIEKTQTSITVLINAGEDETMHISSITNKYNNPRVAEIRRYNDTSFLIKLNRLLTNFPYKEKYGFHFLINIEEEDFVRQMSYNLYNFTTLSVMPKIAVQNSPSVVRALGTYTSGDASIHKTEMGISDTYQQGDTYISELLAPNTTYELKYRVYTSEDSPNYYEETSQKVTTLPLELTTTKEAKSVSNTTAIISATTNLDEMDTRAGFEWRRYDAPDLVPSSRANCPIIDGVMMGALKNLNTNTYYKFRPYYVDINGKEYFGDWSAFGTADAYVYFDPTVRTYSVSSIEDNRAVVRGCAVAGSDAIEEQGFEYWPVDSENVPSMRQLMAMANKQTVKADGQWMTATLSDLNSGQTYAVRAYVKTAKETTYGNTETFTTTNITGINKVFKSSQGLDVKIVDQSRSHVTLNVEGMQGRGRYLLYNLNGAMICNGEIEANAFSQDINTSQLSSGIYLLRVADNKQCKTIRIIVK